MKREFTARELDAVLADLHKDQTAAQKRRYGDPPARCIGVAITLDAPRVNAFPELTTEQIKLILQGPFVIGFDPEGLKEELNQRL